ncbi:T-lymphocyte activation antigen CD86 isoform X1 [Falco biarmicus]|uniref:T-lymphocyte activation antigen CD86 isoform X3 n=1 Tax=Falco cherrug TaxID=345164 RepID=UPI000FFCB13B|nr:T-lymphocyte activation antigen CD86 isoform X3 [Falco cherrug]XP_037246316.1 T-lymphocyte activation antigen CD86 isoform X1 [Falco rusticolus]XP_056197343.1 T-lymphocyte activation antigen CD86 isoform X1 [Falco biarmicus]
MFLLVRSILECFAACETESLEKAISIMEVCIFFLYAMILLPGIAASVHQVKSFLNHTAYLSCYFPNSQKTDIKDLRIFWQKDNEVVHEVYYGQEKHDNLSPKYINRTKMDMDKWTLQLLNAEIVDEGQYMCIIQQREKESARVIHTSECLLNVIANYSQPEIAQLHSGELKPNEYLNLSCSSSGGYPKPKQMTWLISHENKTRRFMHHTDISQDAVTKLYNVTSKLSITVPANTLTNISCLLHLGEQLGSLVSVPLGIEIQGEEIKQMKINFFGPLIAVIVLITILLGFVILKKNRNTSSTDQSKLLLLIQLNCPSSRRLCSL